MIKKFSVRVQFLRALRKRIIDLLANERPKALLCTVFSAASEVVFSTKYENHRIHIRDFGTCGSKK